MIVTSLQKVSCVTALAGCIFKMIILHADRIIVVMRGVRAHRNVFLLAGTRINVSALKDIKFSRITFLVNL